MRWIRYRKPHLITRTEWGCPDGQITSHGPLSYTTVTHLIIHHTVNDNDAPDWREVVLNIWKFHVFERGFADIGYNYLIDPNGAIYEGRAGGDNVQGAHFSGVNAGTMGVGLIGTYTDVEPKQAALHSLEKLFAWKCRQRRLDPLGSSLHAASQLELSTISGHCDGPKPTQCPGDLLYGLLPLIREDVNRMMKYEKDEK
ncbi:MAG: N-acetylmuramoyl-L-alanine amidase [Blastocatellia bacterium]|nr:N-acetylmuramoyl-L-alanine amidase [Blastocatellia bacterium]